MKSKILLLSIIFLVCTSTIGIVVYKNNKNDKNSGSIQDETSNGNQNVDKTFQIDLENEVNTIQQISLIIESDDKKTTYTISNPKEDNIFELLKQIDEKSSDFTFEYQEYDFGVFVISINGFKPDSSKEFWELQINNVDSQVGISDYVIQNNDQLRFVVEDINSL